MSKSCILYIIRHGETEWNVKKLCQGQTDIPLNNKGEIQAGNLSKELSHIKFNAVYSSDLIRAKRTAEIVVLEKKLAVITTKALKERLFGRFEGKHLQELADIIGKSFSLPINKKQQLKFYDLEADEEVVSRVITFLREVSLINLNKNVLISTHGGVIYRLLNHLGINVPDFFVTPMKNTGYLVLECDGVEFFVKENRLF